MKAVLNREAWLTVCAAALVPLFERAGYVVPSNIVFSCSSPSGRVVGRCWSATAAVDGNHQVYVSSALDDALTVAVVLAHEMVHATVGVALGHGAAFRACATAAGLCGPMRSTVPSEAFKRFFHGLRLPPYPHGRLVVPLRAAALGGEGSRLLRVSCEKCLAESRPYLVRMSHATLQRGPPICPIHLEPMEGV